MGTFEAAYASSWHHPFVAWVGGGMVLAWFAYRRDLRPLYVFLLMEILLDAWFSSTLSPLPPDSLRSTRVCIAFVIAGDWRFFFLVERAHRRELHAVLTSVVWAFLVPVTTLLATLKWPSTFANPRHVYLFWEVAMVLVASFFFWRAPRWVGSTELGRQASVLAALVGGYYLLWALADVIILSGQDSGFLLRLLPDALYYVGFVPVAYGLVARERHSALQPAVRGLA